MSNDTLVINIREEGVTGAVGRVLGIQLKDKIILMYDQTKYSRVILNFSQVDYVTSGFAKELFEGLYKEYRENFYNLFSVRVDKGSDALKNTIIRAMATVIKQHTV